LVGLAGGVAAIIVDGRWSRAADTMALKQCRALSPSTALVVLTNGPENDLAREALGSAATVFLDWPAQVEEIRIALASGRR
jgi:hypothetical protein